MRFALAVNMERFDPGTDMREVAQHALEMVKIADQGGFDIVFTGEHHTIEFTISPNPFTTLTHWANHTSQIRLGTATIAAPYWHPIRLAGEAALADLYTDGRLELGIARGAYQYEFDRMANGIPQQEGVAYMKEIVPAVKKLWDGDYAHDGHYWNFPSATSVPKPLQKPNPPLWVAARDPGTFDWAIKNGAHIMTTPLSKPAEEIDVLREKFESALKENPGVERPKFLMLRRACVYDNPDDWRIPVDGAIEYGRRFETLFKGVGDVVNGFPQSADVESVDNHTEYDRAELSRNLLFGTPDEVVEKLRKYEEAGVDIFCYGASFGLPWKTTRRSLELFAEKVIPEFKH